MSVYLLRHCFKTYYERIKQKAKRLEFRLPMSSAVDTKRWRQSSRRQYLRTYDLERGGALGFTGLVLGHTEVQPVVLVLEVVDDQLGVALLVSVHLNATIRR